jgi:hypothetical protein
MEREQFDTCQKYRTRPTAVIVKPKAVGRMNRLLGMYDSNMISRDELDNFILGEIYKGTMLAARESCVVRLTGRKKGYQVEFEMYDSHGRIGDLWWTYYDNIICQTTPTSRH